jgi:hypothetical protein
MSLNLRKINVAEYALQRSLALKGIEEEVGNVIKRTHNLGGKYVRVDGLLGIVQTFNNKGDVNAIINDSIIGTQNINVEGTLNLTTMGGSLIQNRNITNIIKEVTETRVITEIQIQEIIKEVESSEQKMSMQKIFSEKKDKLLFLQNKIVVLYHLNTDNTFIVKGYSGYTQELQEDVRSFYLRLFGADKYIQEKEEIIKGNLEIEYILEENDTQLNKTLKERMKVVTGPIMSNATNRTTVQEELGIDDMESLINDNVKLLRQKILNLGLKRKADIFKEVFDPFEKKEKYEIIGNKNGCMIFLDPYEIDKEEIGKFEGKSYSGELTKNIIKGSPLYKEFYKSLERKTLKKTRNFLFPQPKKEAIKTPSPKLVQQPLKQPGQIIKTPPIPFDQPRFEIIKTPPIKVKTPQLIKQMPVKELPIVNDNFFDIPGEIDIPVKLPQIVKSPQLRSEPFDSLIYEEMGEFLRNYINNKKYPDIIKGKTDKVKFITPTPEEINFFVKAMDNTLITDPNFKPLPRDQNGYVNLSREALGKRYHLFYTQFVKNKNEEEFRKMFGDIKSTEQILGGLVGNLPNVPLKQVINQPVKQPEKTVPLTKYNFSQFFKGGGRGGGGRGRGGFNNN